ncbi:MAG: hypothetical protein ABW065_03080 [Solirubrobacterales bacterium]
MARKEEQNGEEQEVEEEEEEAEEEEEVEESGISINITEDTITIDVPRDGNEGEMLTRLAKLVDGLS